MKSMSFQEPVRIERSRAKKYCPGEYIMVGSYKQKIVCIKCGFCAIKARRLAKQLEINAKTGVLDRINKKCELAKSLIDELPLKQKKGK